MKTHMLTRGATASSSPATAPHRAAMLGSRAAHADPRWPRIVAALAELRARDRRAVRIVDADCACGTLLIEAARHARALGFTSIEARGIDGSPAMIGRARSAAARGADPAIGLVFDLMDMKAALAEEAAYPADIVLFHDRRVGGGRGIDTALAAAGDIVIGEPNPAANDRHAA